MNYTDLAALVLVAAIFAAVITLTIRILWRNHTMRRTSERLNRRATPEEHE